MDLYKPEEGGVAVLEWLEELLFAHQLPLSLFKSLFMISFGDP
jgi:hypothetical protein